MAAGRIKGITIEIGGDTTKLTQALSKVDNALNKTKTNLRDIEKALKFNPSSTALLKDKQVELSHAIEETKQKIQTEKEAYEQLANADRTPENVEKMRQLKTQIDLDTEALRQLEQEARQSASVLGTQMQIAGEKVKEVGEKVKEVGDKIANFGKEMTTKVTLPIVAAGAKAAKSFYAVDKTMVLTNETMASTAEEAEMLDKAMQEAARNSVYGMDEAATATLNFARAGLDAAEAADTLAPAMALAAGEGGDLDTVSAGLVATINGFGDEFANASHYADVFANACNNSALDINSLSDSMSIAAPIFKTAGYSVKDASLYIGVMANAGIDANEAATSLKTGIARLVKPAKEGAIAMENLGIEVTNADGTMKDTITIQSELHDAFSQLSESEQIAAASAIFGKNQMSKWLALINTAPSDVQDLSDALDQEGTAMDMASAMMEGQAGSVERLKSSLDVLMYSLGKIVAEYLQPVIDKLQELTDKFQAMDEEDKKRIVQIAAIVAAIGPALVIIGKVVAAIGTIISAVGSVMSAIGGVMTTLAALGAPILIVIGLIAALVAAFIYFYNTNEEFRAKVQEIWENIKEAVSSFFETCKGWFDQFVEWISPLVDAIVGAVTAVWELVSSIVTMLVDHIQSKMEENRAFIEAALNAIKLIFTTVWTVIKNGVAFTLNAIKTIFTTFFNVLQNLAKAWSALLKGDWKSALEFLKTAATTALNGVKQLFTNFKESLSNIFTGIKDSMLKWGKEMIENLIKGIKEKIQGVKDAMNGVGDAIKDRIHFTHPDEGPLKDFPKWAPDMMNQFAQGITDNKGVITDAVNQSFDLKPYIMSLDKSARMMANNTAPDVMSTNNDVNVSVVLQGGLDRLFRAMVYESQKNQQITGQSALLGV